MARNDARHQDLFMQWYPISVTLDGSDSSALVENQMTTGLSVRGDYAWIIHRVELYMDKIIFGGGADNYIAMCLSIQNELAAMPEVNDKGVICRLQAMYAWHADGVCQFFMPFIWTSLPPTIIAAPKLSLYAATYANFAAFQDAEIIGRIGYTTVPIGDAATYLEIAETFETL